MKKRVVSFAHAHPCCIVLYSDRFWQRVAKSPRCPILELPVFAVGSRNFKTCVRVNAIVFRIIIFQMGFFFCISYLATRKFVIFANFCYIIISSSSSSPSIWNNSYARHRLRFVSRNI